MIRVLPPGMTRLARSYNWADRDETERKDSKDLVPRIIGPPFSDGVRAFLCHLRPGNRSARELKTSWRMASSAAGMSPFRIASMTGL